MSNPLLDRAIPASNVTPTTMRPGDVRTLNVRDKNGAVLKTYTLIRTTREYAYDLADAYNAGRTQDEAHWFVTPTGELKIGHPQEFSVALSKEIERKDEAERARWKARQPIEQPA